MFFPMEAKKSAEKVKDEVPSEGREAKLPKSGDNPTKNDKDKVPKNGGQNVRLKKAGDLESRRYEFIVIQYPKSKQSFEMSSFVGLYNLYWTKSDFT